jgi:hypothetical protein
MNDFDLFIGIDYSGAQTPTSRLPGLQHAGRRFLAGIDHSLSFPGSYFKRREPAAGKSVIVEVYPSIFRSRYPREDRTADEQDAFATARWMADMAERGALAQYFSPPLSDAERTLAGLEGWILGVR